MDSKDLLPTVLDLPSAERAALAHALLCSLHEVPSDEQRIVTTLTRRAREVEEGKARLVDAREALDRIARRHR
jgi:hypothetical protein